MSHAQALSGIGHAQALHVFGKVGCRIAREGKHTILSNGKVRLTIPGHTAINPFTMAGIAKDAGLTPEQFRELM